MCFIEAENQFHLFVVCTHVAQKRTWSYFDRINHSTCDCVCVCTGVQIVFTFDKRYSAKSLWSNIVALKMKYTIWNESHLWLYCPVANHVLWFDILRSDPLGSLEINNKIQYYTVHKHGDLHSSNISRTHGGTNLDVSSQWLVAREPYGGSEGFTSMDWIPRDYNPEIIQIRLNGGQGGGVS